MVVLEPKLSALLVMGEDDASLRINDILHGLGIQTQCVRTCREAAAALQHAGLPQLVFSGVALPDGTWAEVLRLAASGKDVPVILVSRLPDVQLYLDALESGVTDFISPPFVSAEIAHVVKCAVWPPHSYAPHSALAAMA
jgi:CheY-like chemotaxis protein